MPWSHSVNRARLVGVVALVQIGGTVLASTHQHPHRALDWAGVVLLGAPVVALVWLRRWAVGVLAAVFVTTLAYSSFGYRVGRSSSP